MTRLGLGCLQVLYDENIDNILDARTINELLRITCLYKSFDYQKLYRTLNDLYNEGYVDKGAKNGKAMTYYLTESGKALIRGFC